MDYQKLFQVLVVGGALVGGATACNEGSRAAEQRPGDTGGTGGSGAADAGTAGGGQRDAGTPAAGGGGVKGW